MKYYKLTLEILSPVYIGSGKVIGKMEYVYDSASKIIYVMNTAKLFEGLRQEGLLKQYEHMLINAGNKKEKITLRSLLMSRRISTEKIKSWSEYSYSAEGSDFKGGEMTENYNFYKKRRASNEKDGSDINAFMRDNYLCPYIPGSSLKGAIRTAIINYEVDQGGFQNEAKEIEKEISKFRPTGYESKDKARDKKTLDRRLAPIIGMIEDRITHNLNRKEKQHDILNDCFTGLRVSDSKPLSNNDIVLCQKIDTFVSDGDNPLNVFRECLRPGTKVEFDITIDERYFKYTIEDIRKAINYMDKNYCDMFLQSFDDVEPMEGRIWLGGGVGYPTKTIMYSLYNFDTILEVVSEYFCKTTDKKHGHDKDIEAEASPHTRKQTYYNNDWIDFGMCRASFKEMKY